MKAIRSRTLELKTFFLLISKQKVEDVRILPVRKRKEKNVKKTRKHMESVYVFFITVRFISHRTNEDMRLSWPSS